MVVKRRVIQAMLHLRRFTVAQVAAAAGVKEATVRTVIYRTREHLVATGRASTERRGGRPVEYAIREGADAELRSLSLQESSYAPLETAAGAPPAGEVPEGEAALLSALDYLAELPGVASENRGLLAIADSYARQHALPATEDARLYRRAFDNLRAFVEAESGAGDDGQADWERLVGGVQQAATELEERGMGPLARALRARLGGSRAVLALAGGASRGPAVAARGAAIAGRSARGLPVDPTRCPEAPAVPGRACPPGEPVMCSSVKALFEALFSFVHQSSPEQTDTLVQTLGLNLSYAHQHPPRR
jgi:hypothetical protein